MAARELEDAKCYLRAVLESAASQCDWNKADFEQLATGVLPARTQEHYASINVAVVFRALPGAVEDKTHVVIAFAVQRLGRV